MGKLVHVHRSHSAVNIGDLLNGSDEEVIPDEIYKLAS